MFGRKRGNKGFTVAELVIVLAVLAVLGGLATTGVIGSSVALKKKDYDNSAEVIAVAAQVTMSEMLASGDSDKLLTLGEDYSSVTGEAGDRYIFSGTASAETVLPFMSIEEQTRQGNYVISFRAKTGKVNEAFYFADGFPAEGAALIEALAVLRETPSNRVGHYGQPNTDPEDVTITEAQLPTPQISVINNDVLTVSVYLPYVRQLPKDKRLSLDLLLVRQDTDAAKVLEDPDRAENVTVYSTAKHNVDVVVGTSYSFVLDTPAALGDGEFQNYDSPVFTGDAASVKLPTAKFASWARLSSEFVGDGGTVTGIDTTVKKQPILYDLDGFMLGDDVKMIAVVTALPETGYDPDPSFIPRRAEAVFNGWFAGLSQKDDIKLADVSCGRHLQNLAKLTHIRKNLEYLLPVRNADGTYSWSVGNGNSFVRSTTYNYDKYVRFNYVVNLGGANQLMPIDFGVSTWKGITFDPINPVTGFYYYGNYFPIRNINVVSDVYAGLFGYTYRSHIYDVRLVNPNVKSYMPLEVSKSYEMGVGALIGTDRASSAITNCQVYLETDGSTDDLDCRVTGNGYVGGLIGFCEDEDLRQCSASCYVGDEATPYVGGLVGAVTGDSNIKRCYAAGILAGQYVGGILGAYIPDTDYSGDSFTLESCYAAGNITYAGKESGGLIGYSESEQPGYEKAAVRAHKNYCVIIYGRKNSDGNYYWPTSAPIYGTFNGDNLMWVYADMDIVATDADDTDGFRVLTAASYDYNNYNFYIPQKDIEYAHSGIFQNSEFMKTVTDFVENYGNADTITEAQIQPLLDEVVKNKRLQVLSQLRVVLQDLYEQVVEKGNLKDPFDPSKNILIDFDFDNTPNNTKAEYDADHCQVASHSPKADDTRRTTSLPDVIASILGSDTKEKSVYWFITQLENMLNGSTVTVEDVNYSMNGAKGQDFDALFEKFASYFFQDNNQVVWKKDSEGHDTNEADKYYWPANEKGQNRGSLAMAFYDVRRYFEAESYYTRSDVYHSDGRLRTENGYAIAPNGDLTLYGTVLRRGFNTDDYKSNFDGSEEHYLLDESGMPVVKHEGDNGYYIMDNFLDVIQDYCLSMLYSVAHYDPDADWQNKYIAADVADKLWNNSNYEYAKDVLKHSKRYISDITGMTEEIHSGTLNEDINGQTILDSITKIFGVDVKAASGESEATAGSIEDKAMFKALFDELSKTDGTFNSIRFQKICDDLIAQLNKLYKYFDKAKDYYSGDYYDTNNNKLPKNSDARDHMGSLRDEVSSLITYVDRVSRLSRYGGLEDPLLSLLDAIEYSKEDSAYDLAAAIKEYVGRINYAALYDSGYPIYDPNVLGRLRDLTMDTTDWGGDGAFDSGDWYGYTDWSTYKYGEGGNYNSNLVLKVFPYHENGEYTKVYPFPMIVAAKTQSTDTRVTPMLYHYGDWLTPDLWAYNTSVTEALRLISDELDRIDAFLTRENKDTSGQYAGDLRTFENAVKQCRKDVDDVLADSTMTDSKAKDKLTTIRNTINGWLATNGQIAKVKDGLEKAKNSGSNSKKKTAATLLAGITDYEKEFQAIIAYIDKILT